jgi:hypothetical protein
MKNPNTLSKCSTSNETPAETVGVNINTLCLYNILSTSLNDLFLNVFAAYYLMRNSCLS